MPRTPSILIIGAGATGMLADIKLREAGITDITLIEKADRVGGTWRENTYPGIACDIPALHYCYSFEPYVWSHHLAHGDELQAYMEHVAEKYGINQRARFGETVTSCTYGEDGKWHVSTDKGDAFAVDFVISATGILHHPRWPDIEGREAFAGEHWHTAQWRHDVDLKGKRIGVLGTGSTAHQLIPELINAGHDVSVFQRTPQWVAPVPNLRFPGWLKRRWQQRPARMRAWKAMYRWLVHSVFINATIGKWLPNKVMNVLCRTHLWRIRDRDLRAKLTPDYEVGCKRLVINTTFYPAIQKPNAKLITEPIDRIEAGGIRTQDGTLHQLDVLICATGFYNFNYMRPMALTGRNGHTIEQSWGDGHYATHRGVLLRHFPNFILMLGPGTPIGNNTIIGIAERQMHYVMQLIDLWRSGQTDTIEPTERAVREFSDYIARGVGDTVWVGGCQSWYLDASGQPTIFPYDWDEFLRLTRAPDPSELDLSTPRA
ncbi:MAG: NAD(P)/FAD-dependent oxidoreductase [Pseudomonadota bacterium]